MPQNIPSKRSGPGCFGKDGFKVEIDSHLGAARVDRPTECTIGMVEGDLK